MTVIVRILSLPIVVVTILLGAPESNAQGIGYAEAVDRLATRCRDDIVKYCAKVNLGGGRMAQCLAKPEVSLTCKSSLKEMDTLVISREKARASIMKVCDVDIRRFCEGMKAVDGNLLECFFKVRQNVSAQCRKAVSDAGYDVTVSASTPTSQVGLSSNDLINSLQSVESAGQVSATALRQMAMESLKDPTRKNRINRPPLVGQLEKQAQLTIAIKFDFNSARINPDSFRAVGLMADALNHPYLQAYRFIIVGHTDAKGNRENNLKLSQQRAEAVLEALIKPFGIKSSRLEAVGLGEEQLLKPASPEDAENRRVQLINVGPVR